MAVDGEVGDNRDCILMVRNFSMRYRCLRQQKSS